MEGREGVHSGNGISTMGINKWYTKVDTVVTFKSFQNVEKY